MSSTTDTTSDAEKKKKAILGAATFIRDLYYNPKLRDSYFQALNTASPRRKAAVNKVLKPYNCTIDNLGAGWSALENQSFLAWQSVYTLDPLKTTVNGKAHTCTIVGSRTGKTIVLFDNDSIIGFKPTIPKDGTSKPPTITWDTKSSNGTLNVSLVLDHDAPSGDTSNIQGNRRMRAKIWAENETEPTDYTHSGFDFFSNIGMFNGKYDTLVTDVDSGDQSDGLPATVKVNFSDSTKLTTATVDLNITADDKSELSIAKALACDRDSIQWDKDNNKSIATWPDGTSSNWRQGYLGFSWEYIPPKPTSDGQTDASLKAKFSGSIWLDSMDNCAQIDGNIQTDSISSDISNAVAIVVGAVASAGLFLLIGVGIYVSLKKFIGWVKDKLVVQTKEDKKETATDKEVVNEKSSSQALDKVDQIADIPTDTHVTDYSDMRTLEPQMKDGERVKSYRGENTHKNPRDPSTSLADLHVTGESSVGKEVVNNDGTQLKSLDSIPTIKNPIENIKTKVKTDVKQLGKQFTHVIVENKLDAQRALTHEGEDMIDFEAEKIEIRL